MVLMPFRRIFSFNNFCWFLILALLHQKRPEYSSLTRILVLVLIILFVDGKEEA